MKIEIGGLYLNTSGKKVFIFSKSKNKFCLVKENGIFDLCTETECKKKLIVELDIKEPNKHNFICSADMLW